MRMALTTRQGNDTSPLVLRIENTGWDRLPPLGTQVRAYGLGGWSYWGVVAGHDADGVHYNVRVTVAANRIADNLRNWHQAMRIG